MNHLSNQRLIVAVLMIVLFTGCAAPPASPTPPWPSPATLSPAPTHIRTATLSPAPTATRTPTPAPTRTSRVWIPSPSPTLQPFATADLNPLPRLDPPPAAQCPHPDPSLAFDPTSLDAFANLYDVPVDDEAFDTSYVAPFMRPWQEAERIDSSFDAQYAVVEKDMLAFLSAGGSVDRVRQHFERQKRLAKPLYLGKVQQTDLTGDGLPELFVWIALRLSANAVEGFASEDDIIETFSMPVQYTRVYTFSCQDGRYVTLGTFLAPLSEVDLPEIVDLNGDGVGEVVLPSYGYSMSRNYLDLYILGWDGQQFNQLVRGYLSEDYLSSFMFTFLGEEHATVPFGEYKLQDLDGNGTTEVILSGGVFMGQKCSLLYRDTRIVLMWDGEGFTGYYRRTPATYRIQAIWDGDHLSAHGLYAEARTSYLAAIHDSKLLSWGPGFENYDSPRCNRPATLTPVPPNPVVDESEPRRLAAYAWYRLMLLDLIDGDPAKAEESYTTLRQEYGQEFPAYIELAAHFWEAYQKTRNMRAGCQAAISYAHSHANDTIYTLGIHAYNVPYGYLESDICPFE